jgi:hypothetical protein
MPQRQRRPPVDPETKLRLMAGSERQEEQRRNDEETDPDILQVEGVLNEALWPPEFADLSKTPGWEA